MQLKMVDIDMLNIRRYVDTHAILSTSSTDLHQFLVNQRDQTQRFHALSPLETAPLQRVTARRARDGCACHGALGPCAEHPREAERGHSSVGEPTGDGLALIPT